MMATVFYFSVLDQKKSKKNIEHWKKNIKPILGKLIRATILKKNIGRIFGKVSEGDKIKKTFDIF